MGLDVSHDCWHGAYSAFMRWRMKLAEVAGIPLPFMDMFYFPGDVLMDPFYWQRTSKDEFSQRKAEEVDRFLPLPWTLFDGDPLVHLLRHEDDRGHLDQEVLRPLANRLEELLPKLPDEDGGGHVRNWRVTTQRFIDGLRRAADAGERVEFR